MSKSKKGQFFVKSDECVTCGCCGNVAPTLFNSDWKIEEQSFVKKQPETDHELRMMFRASRICMVDCIYYDGKNQLLKEHFLKIYSCFEQNGNVCSLEHCPCFDRYLTARTIFKDT